MLPRPYVGSYEGKKGHQLLQEPWILELAQSVETIVMVLISDMRTVQYCNFFKVCWIKQKRRFPNNLELVIHVLRHWQLLEVIFSQYIRRILIFYTKTETIFCQ